MARLVVHIGLPKTATTALQTDYFPRLPDSQWVYLGVSQPRASAQQPLYEEFIRAVDSGDTAPVRAEFEALIAAGKSLVISDECLVVSSANSSWRTRLQNLATLVTGSDYAMLVTVRRPERAMFSYFVEFFPKFSSVGSFFDVALSHPDMEIYHYRKLFSTLFDVFEQRRVTVESFENITAGDLAGIDGLLGVSAPGRLRDRNRRERDAGHANAPRPRTAGTLVRGIAGKTGVRRMRSFEVLRRYARPLLHQLDRVRFGRQRVRLPSDEEFARLASFVAADTGILAELYNIRYE